MEAPTIVIVGGDAAGMSAASRARRTSQDATIVALERGRYTSYAACGLPYFIGGAVGDVDDLVSRTPEEHRAHGIDLRTGHEALDVDTRLREVTVRSPDGDYSLHYDKLVLATGASARCPKFAKVDMDGVFTLRTIPEALAIDSYVRERRPERAVLIGGGYIGMEMAEALVERGVHATLVEHGSQVLKALDEDMASIVADVLAANGVDLLYGHETQAFLGDSRVSGVRFTAGEEIPAELVVVGVGPKPNVGLAQRAGIALGQSGAIAVDNAQRTSAFHVYAAGDCAEAKHVVLDRNVYIPLGTTANKQGRVAGDNVGGGRSTFGGVAGTMVCKVFDSAFARTGLSDSEARRYGLSPASAKIAAPSRSGYYNDPPDIHVKLTFDSRSRRLLGGQLVGDETVAKRIDVVATALHARMTIDTFSQLDLSYAPPFAPVWDPLLVAANVARR